MRKLCMMAVCVGVLSIVGTLAMPDNAISSLVKFSRANCVNNESVTFDPDGYIRSYPKLYWLATNSYHWNGSWHCVNNVSNDCSSAGYELDWHTAGIHWGEGTGGWYVLGYHWWTGAVG